MSVQLELDTLPIADPEWARERARSTKKVRGRPCIDCDDPCTTKCRSCKDPVCAACSPDGRCSDCLCAEFEEAMGDALDVEDGEPLTDRLLAETREHLQTQGIQERSEAVAELAMVYGVSEATAGVIVDAAGWAAIVDEASEGER